MDDQQSGLYQFGHVYGVGDDPGHFKVGAKYCFKTNDRCLRLFCKRDAFCGSGVYYLFHSTEWGIQLEAFAAALLAMAIMGSAFICEIVASGVNSIPKGQWEAAESSGLTYFQQLRFVIMPQAMRIILPPLVGQYVLLIKDTSVVSVIGVMDLTRVGWVTVVRIPEGLMVFTLVGLLYFAISYPLILLSNYLEKRMAV